jgi:hypothetical protein
MLERAGDSILSSRYRQGTVSTHTRAPLDMEDWQDMDYPIFLEQRRHLIRVGIIARPASSAVATLITSLARRESCASLSYRGLFGIRVLSGHKT